MSIFVTIFRGTRHKIVLDVIIDNMASLVKLGKYGAINESYPTTIGYYVIKCLSKTYTLQAEQTIDGKLSKAGGLVVKSEYLSIMKRQTNWYWQQHRTNQSVIISTRTIVHQYLEVSVIKNVTDIPRGIFNKKQPHQAVQRQPIFIDDEYHDYILYEIERRDNIEYERQVHNDDK